MNNPTATKQYVINELPTDPSQITSGSLNTTIGTFGSITIHYQKVGKLYFDIWFASGGGLSVLFGSLSGGSQSDAHTTMNQVASLLGVTVNTYYDSINYGAYTAAYATGTWNGQTPGNSNRNIVTAFLAN